MRSCWKSLTTLFVVVGLCLTMLTGIANAGEPVKPVPTDQPGTVTPLGSSCWTGLCSQINNKSHTWVYLARDWCGSDSYKYQDEPPCGWGSVTRYLYAGEITPQFEDWDSFRVDAGWRYYYTVYFRGCPCWSSRSVDRRGSATPAWVRVRDNEVVVIERQQGI